MNAPAPDTQLKPLSFMEKIVVGVKSFVKSAIDYVPSGLLYSALMIGGSLAITALTGGIGTGGYDALNLVGENGAITLSSLATKAAVTIGLGSAVTGTIGAVKGVMAASDQRSNAMEWQQRGVQVSPRARGQQRAQSTGFTTQTPQRGLPQQQHQHGHSHAPGF